MRGAAVSAFTSDITYTGLHYAVDGRLYQATNYRDGAVNVEIPFFYVKNIGPFWFVADAASGP